MKALAISLLMLGAMFARTPSVLADVATATVVVTVRDQTGAVLPSANIETVKGSFITHFFADGAGKASLSFALSAPTTIDRICAEYPPSTDDFSACASPVTVAPGETKMVNLVIDLTGGASTATPSPSASSVTGRGWILGVVSLAGTQAPVPGVSIRLASTPLRTTTDAAGHYQFPALSVTDGANGGPTYTVLATPPPGYAVVGLASQTVTVQADHGVEADFTLQAVPCRFVLGFQALHAAIPTIVGDCVDDEQHNPANGDALQHTANGLLVWRKADNFTAFTDGYRTWVNGPNGIAERLNTQRFP